MQKLTNAGFGECRCGGACVCIRWFGCGSALWRGPRMSGHDDDATRDDGSPTSLERRLAFLKGELGIKPARSPLWNAYAAAVRTSAKNMAAHCDGMMGQRGSTPLRLPERLDQHQKFMTLHLEQMRSVTGALKALYAGLDETQKKTADDLIWSPMGMM